jgi:hypothetical protein
MGFAPPFGNVGEAVMKVVAENNIDDSCFAVACLLCFAVVPEPLALQGLTSFLYGEIIEVSC